MLDRNAVALDESFADAQAVAPPRVGFEAQQASGPAPGEVGGGGQLGLGLGRRELLVDDAPKRGHVVALVGEAALFGRAERAQVHVTDARVGQFGVERRLGKAGASRQGQLAHVEERRDAPRAQRLDDRADVRVLVP